MCCVLCCCSYVVVLFCALVFCCFVVVFVLLCSCVLFCCDVDFDLSLLCCVLYCVVLCLVWFMLLLTFQHTQNEIKKELDRLLFTSHESVHEPALAEDEVTAVKRNLQTNNVEASPAEVCNMLFIISQNVIKY